MRHVPIPTRLVTDKYQTCLKSSLPVYMCAGSSTTSNSTAVLSCIDLYEKGKDVMKYGVHFWTITSTDERKHKEEVYVREFLDRSESLGGKGTFRHILGACFLLSLNNLLAQVSRVQYFQVYLARWHLMFGGWWHCWATGVKSTVMASLHYFAEVDHN